MRLRASVEKPEPGVVADRLIQDVKHRRGERHRLNVKECTPKGLPLQFYISFDTDMGELRVSTAGTPLLQLGPIRIGLFQVILLLPTDEELVIELRPG